MSSPTPTRDPYRGNRRKLVLAFDVGATYSGISYSILDPGQVPEIKGVTRFFCCDYMRGRSKIPTVIYYDQSGKMQAVGASTYERGMHERAEENMWSKAEWFKLHLSSSIGANSCLKDIPPLPLNKSATDVFADFLRYLLQCSASCIEDSHANGAQLWRSVKDGIDFVLSHPNGWGGSEHSQMRKAAVLAGLIPDNAEGHARLSFVTEGEASLRFALYSGLPSEAMTNSSGVVIVDAGGGTIDTSFYARRTDPSSQISSVQPTTRASRSSDMQHRLVNILRLQAQVHEETYKPSVKDTPKAHNNHVKTGHDFEEIAPPQSHFQGSVFVTLRAGIFLREYTATSRWSEYLDDLVNAFDRSTKLRFRNDNYNEPQYINFGKPRDNDATYNIRYGQLKLQGSDVAVFFQPSIDSIINVIEEQMQVLRRPISHVVLVGGFAANDWLLDGVKTALAPHGLEVFRPEGHVCSKAVADGAISFYLDQLVCTRVSKFTYGYFCDIRFNQNVLDHRERARNTFISTTGETRIKDSFNIILPRNAQLSETEEIRRSFFKESKMKEEFDTASLTIWCYRGLLPEPKWKDVDTDNYTELCTIEADLSHLPLRSHPESGSRRGYYWLDYDLILSFGLTELKAYVSWKEIDLEKRSPAKIVYNPYNKYQV